MITQSWVHSDRFFFEGFLPVQKSILFVYNNYVSSWALYIKGIHCVVPTHSHMCRKDRISARMSLRCYPKAMIFHPLVNNPMALQGCLSPLTSYIRRVRFISREFTFRESRVILCFESQSSRSSLLCICAKSRDLLASWC